MSKERENKELIYWSPPLARSLAEDGGGEEETETWGPGVSSRL